MEESVVLFVGVFLLGGDVESFFKNITKTM